MTVSLIINDEVHQAAAEAELVGTLTADFKDGVARLNEMYISRTGSEFSVVVETSPRTIAPTESVTGINVLSRQFNAEISDAGRVLVNDSFTFTARLLDRVNGRIATNLDWRVCQPYVDCSHKNYYYILP